MVCNRLGIYKFHSAVYAEVQAGMCKLFACFEASLWDQGLNGDVKMCHALLNFVNMGGCTMNVNCVRSLYCYVV